MSCSCTQHLPSEHIEADALARARAFADPHRLAFARLLSERGSMYAGDFSCCSDPDCQCGCKQRLASHHLQVMQQAGAVMGERDGRRVRYSLTPWGQQLLEVVS